MKSSIRQARYFRSNGGKAVMTLAFAALLSGLSIAPAFADKDDGHGWQQNRKDDQHRKLERHGGRQDYGYRPEYRSPNYSYGQPYSYAQPVYVPPPVYYQPRPSPGINLFFPFDFRD